MTFKITQYFPGFIERRDDRSLEAIVGTQEEVLALAWIKNYPDGTPRKGVLTIEWPKETDRVAQGYVKGDGFVVALIHPVRT